MFFLGISAKAQNITVKSFQALPMDMTASSLEGKRIDQNGVAAALIKIVTSQTGFAFDGGTLGIVDSKQMVGEIWVWVPYGSRKITITHQQLGVLREYRYPINIESERTYEMVLTTISSETVVKENAPVQALIFEVTPRNATLEVNDEVWELDRDGKAMKLVNFDTYTYRVQAKGYHPNAGKVTITDPSTPQLVKVKLCSESAINGEYSVSASKQVLFSKGNLQYQASTNSWRFAEHQWDCIGEGNKNISETYNGWIDLFGWGTGNNPTKKNGMMNPSVYSPFVDWGSKILTEDGPWRTLTAEEWYYVLDVRSVKSGIRFAKAVVNGIKGLILLPDDWDKDYYALKNANDKKVLFEGNIISESDWLTDLESHGALFLPAAGARGGKQVDTRGIRGMYWSSTPMNGDCASYISIENDDVDTKPTWPLGRANGYSVRLVRETIR